jgi:hypothetical protein
MSESDYPSHFYPMPCPTAAPRATCHLRSAAGSETPPSPSSEAFRERNKKTGRREDDEKTGSCGSPPPSYAHIYLRRTASTPHAQLSNMPICPSESSVATFLCDGILVPPPHLSFLSGSPARPRICVSVSCRARPNRSRSTIASTNDYSTRGCLSSGVKSPPQQD